MLAWLALFLSWGSLGLETATVVVSSPGGSGLDRILSDSDCQAGNCWLKWRDGALWEPGPSWHAEAPGVFCAPIVLKREKTCLLVTAAAVAENQGGRKMGHRLKIQSACARPHWGGGTQSVFMHHERVQARGRLA